MKIAIRLDDISEDMNWEKFLRFKGLLDMYRIKPLIGVIPQNKDLKLINFREIGGEKIIADVTKGDFWGFVKNLQDEGWIVAMHGVNHVYTTRSGGMFPLNHNSEFAGLKYEEQYALLNSGVMMMKEHGITTDMFMAPSHSYDKNTLKSLEKLGFSKITDGFGTEPYLYNNIIFYPISYNRKSVLKDKNNSRYTTFVYHTNTMDEKDFERFEEQLKLFNFISYDEFLNAVPKKRGLLGRIKEYIMADGKRRLVNLKKLI